MEKGCCAIVLNLAEIAVKVLTEAENRLQLDDEMYGV